MIRNPKGLQIDNVSEYMVIAGESNEIDTLREFSSNPNNRQNYQSLKLSAINAALSSIESIKDYEKLLFRDKEYKEFQTLLKQVPDLATQRLFEFQNKILQKQLQEIQLNKDQYTINLEKRISDLEIKCANQQESLDYLINFIKKEKNVNLFNQQSIQDSSLVRDENPKQEGETESDKFYYS